MSRGDYDAWLTYVTGEVARFFDHCDGETYVWQPTAAAARHVARFRGDEHAAAFTGPWHVVRPHVTAEFRQWVEEHEGTERITFSQWQAREVAARAEVAWMDSADYALGQLEELRRLASERDSLIVEAARRGASKVAIARSVGLSRQQVHTIVAGAEIASLAPVTPIRREVADSQVELRQLASGEWVEVF